jgi:K+-sensing histidine kinase KdpD
MATIYRNYDIAHVGDTFVGQSKDDESLLVSKNRTRVVTAIDQLWASLDRGVAPSWFSGSSAIDLDTVDLESDAVELASSDAGPESYASETDPPRKISYTLFVVSALLVAVPLSFLLGFLSVPIELDVLFSIGVCAVTAAFGTPYGILLSVISAGVYNLFVIPPIFAFTVPCCAEWADIIFNVTAAIGIPWILKRARG